MSLAQDIRFGFRVMIKNPGMTAAAVAALAVGIGLNSTVFTLVNAVLFKGPPYKDPETVIVLAGFSKSDPTDLDSVPLADFREIREASRSFQGLVAAVNFGGNLADGSKEPERHSGSRISSETFQLLGQKPVLGRDFSAEDGQPGSAPVVLLGSALWKSRYGSRPDIVGQTVRINEITHTVIGIMPERFQYPTTSEFWVPLIPQPESEKRGTMGAEVFGRLREGVTLQQADDEVRAISANIAQAYPETNKDLLATVTTIGQRYNGGPIRLVFLTMLGAVGFVLLIACANVANLMLARAITRQRETSIRTALGAGRGRLIRQLLVESVLLSLTGGLVGLLLASAGVGLFDRAVEGVGKPYWIDFSMDYRVFLYFAAICVTTGILFGIAPALQATRTGVNERLKDGGRGSSGGRRNRRLTAVLVTAEIALTLALMVGAGLMTRSFFKLQNFATGFEEQNMLLGRLTLDATKYPDAGRRLQFAGAFLERLASIPGVRAAALASHRPVAGMYQRRLELRDRDIESADGTKPEMGAIAVTPSFFETGGIRVVRGRAFNDADGTEASPVAMVNETFATTYWPGQDPIGRQIRLIDTPDSPWLTVIGVTAHFVQGNARMGSRPLVVLPLRQEAPSSLAVLLRGQAEGTVTAAVIRGALQEIDPNLPIADLQTFAEFRYIGSWEYRVFGSMFLIFATIATVLSAVGIYAVTTYSVNERRSEIGVRMALGAGTRDVLLLVARQGMMQLGVGLGIGMMAAFAVGRLMSSLLWETSSTDAVTMISIPLLLSLVTALACFIPAGRAARIDPVEALR